MTCPAVVHAALPWTLPPAVTTYDEEPEQVTPRQRPTAPDTWYTLHTARKREGHEGKGRSQGANGRHGLSHHEKSPHTMPRGSTAARPAYCLLAYLATMSETKHLLLGPRSSTLLYSVADTLLQ